jgi:hypothetical protein
MKSIKEVLVEARDLIVDNGWCQHQAVWYKDGKPQAYCLVGAIATVTDRNTPLYLATVNHVKSYIDGRNVSEWNDAFTRNKHEVVELLDKVIETA